MSKVMQLQGLMKKFSKKNAVKVCSYSTDLT
jgi:hypothetical protein